MQKSKGINKNIGRKRAGRRFQAQERGKMLSATSLHRGCCSGTSCCCCGKFRFSGGYHSGTCLKPAPVAGAVLIYPEPCSCKQAICSQYMCAHALHMQVMGYVT